MDPKKRAALQDGLNQLTTDTTILGRSAELMQKTSMEKTGLKKSGKLDYSALPLIEEAINCSDRLLAILKQIPQQSVLMQGLQKEIAKLCLELKSSKADISEFGEMNSSNRLNLLQISYKIQTIGSITRKAGDEFAKTSPLLERSLFANADKSAGKRRSSPSSIDIGEIVPEKKQRRT